MKAITNDTLKWYETHLNDYFYDTVYNTDKLMIELSEDKWFKINPTRGIRNGISSYDLTGNKSELASLLRECYGEIEYDEMIIDKKQFRFTRRTVASGGALYPNLLYLIEKNEGKLNVYQYNPALNLLHFINCVDEDISTLFKENECYIFVTIYYWRNWLKYRYFGYRLMGVDTGYLMANIYEKLAKRDIPAEIMISNELFSDLKKVIDIDSYREGICFAVKTNKFNIAKVCEEQFKKSIYNIQEDWDTVDIPIYKIIEDNSLNEKYNYIEKVSSLNKERILKSESVVLNRISPGGAVVQTVKPIDKNCLTDTLKILKILVSDCKTLADSIVIYIYINIVNGYKRGVYEFDPLGSEGIKLSNNEDLQLQSIMKKHNFSIDNIPALFFVGCKNVDFDSISCNDFKFLQNRVGFVSHMLTVAAAFNNCYTHPILGYDSLLAEKLLNEKNLLNLVVFSETKPLDRQRIIFDY
ncbi:MAG: hypothetical protein HUJ68_04855 [Clostridia bacterium]|nr:hypothetical protein [Clostridia bacterium]